MAGIEELWLPSTELILPSRDIGSYDLETAAGDEAWTQGTSTWAEQQVLRLAVAAVLESELLNTRTRRLEVVGLSTNPWVVTLEQLAVVFRPHNGSAGQAFELAVADAVNAGFPAVVEPLREAMALLGVTDSGPLRMVTVGAEKVPAARRQEFWDSVAAAVGPDAVLRTGRRGRPA